MAILDWSAPGYIPVYLSRHEDRDLSMCSTRQTEDSPSQNRSHRLDGAGYGFANSNQLLLLFCRYATIFIGAFRPPRSGVIITDVNDAEIRSEK